MASRPVHTIALLGEQRFTREAVARLITDLGGYRIAANTHSAAELHRATSSNTRPDIVILCLHTPSNTAIESLRYVAEHLPSAKVLVLSVAGCASMLVHALCAGIRGFMDLDNASEELPVALQNVKTSGFHYNTFMRERLMATVLPEEDAPPQKILDQITEREMVFLKWLYHPAEYTYEEIAKKMKISPAGVHKHRDNLCEKFSVKGKAGLMRFILQWKLYNYWA